MDTGFLQLRYALFLRNEMHVGAGVGKTGFLDKYVYRSEILNGEKIISAVPAIPGSTVKGRIKAAVRMLQETEIWEGEEPCRGTANCQCMLCLLFGVAGNRPGILIFDDALPVEAVQATHVRRGTAVDRMRGVVIDKALYNQETAGFPEQEFCGVISGFVPQNRRLVIIQAIKDALRFEYAVGSGKNRGLGWISRIEVEEVKRG